MKRKLIFCIMLSAGVTFSGTSSAKDQFAPTDAEMAGLPPFCRVKISGDTRSPQYISMMSQYGRGNFIHIHHLCFAMNFVNRARVATRSQDREHLYSVARGNYLYMVKHTEKNFFLRPAIYTELGKVYLELKQPGEALKYFQAAIQFDPKYVQAYGALIEFHRKNKSQKDVLDTATLGLRHLPDNTYLQEAYLSAGGKKPFPEPLQANAQPETAPPDSTTTADVPAEREAVETTSNALDNVPDSGCRFCPPDEIQERWEKSFRAPE